MYFLVFYMFTYSAVVIPEKYSTLSECDSAGKTLNAQWYRCVPAPSFNCHYETVFITPGTGMSKKVCD